MSNWQVEANTLIRDLAWPITVLIITFLFRAEFRRTLGRLATLRYHDFEANFEQGLREAENLAHPSHAGHEAAAPEVHATAPAHRMESGLLLRVADVSPTAAITEAWRDLEQAAASAGEALGVAGRRGESAASHAMHAMVDRDLISSHGLVIYERLRRLSQQAARHPDLKFSSNQAHRFVELAHRLVEKIRGVSATAGVAPERPLA